MVTDAERARSVRERMPGEGLFAGHEWRVSPSPFNLGSELAAELDTLGRFLLIKLVGEDHVSLGSDFDGGPEPPRGMRDIGDYGQITDALLRKGYPEQRIRKVLGLNLLRLFRQVTEK